MLRNLIKEMAVSKISQEDIAVAINVHRNTVANKLEGKGKFSVESAMIIQKKFFPTLGLGYLFEDANSEP